MDEDHHERMFFLSFFSLGLSPLGVCFSGVVFRVDLRGDAEEE